MPRGRTVRPEFFRDKLMGRLGSRVVVVYQALWVFADDGGVARIEPDVLKGEAFVRWPEYTHAVIVDCLVTLHGAKRVRPYAVGDELYGELPNLAEHSKINRPSDFRYPRGGQEVEDIRAWLSGQVTHDALMMPSSPVLPMPLPVAVPDTKDTHTRRDVSAESAAETELLANLPSNCIESLTGILRVAGTRRGSVAASIRAICPGGAQEANTWAEVGQAILDLMAASNPVFEPRRFRVFARKVREDAQGRGPGAGTKTPAEIMRASIDRRSA